MSVLGFTNIQQLNQTDLMSVVVERINENSSLTNSILSEINGNIYPTIENIGNTSNLATTGTLVEQSNFNYALVTSLASQQALAIDFSDTEPSANSDGIKPALWFDTEKQNLMVYNNGDNTYYASYGCCSEICAECIPAPEWINQTTIPPDPPVIVDASCYLPNPILQEGEIRKIKTFSTGYQVLSANTKSNITFILSKNGSYMNLDQYDIKTDQLETIVSLNFYRKNAAIVFGSDADTIFIVGGREANGNLTDTIFGVDISTNVVSQYTDFPIPIDTSNVSYNFDKTKAYFFGGGIVSNSYSDKVYEMNLTSAVISEVATLPSAMTGITATGFTDSNGLIYLIGGRKDNTGMVNSLSKTILSFDPITNEIEVVDEMSLGRSDGIAFCGDSELYHIGGYAPKDSSCIGISQDIVRIYPYGSNWLMIGIGSINISGINVYGTEIKECSYGVIVVDNGTSNDEIFIIGL